MTVIERKMEEKGIGPTELVRLSELPERSLYNWRKGRTPVPGVAAIKLAEIFECEVTEIIENKQVN
jgi:hypothetical protein